MGWCNDNHLLLTVSKTKEIVVDFRRAPPPPDSSPTGYQWRGSWVRRAGLNHWLQVGLVPECLGPPEKGGLLHEEDGVFQRLSKVAEAVLQVHRGCWMGWHSAVSVTSVVSKNRTRLDCPRSPRLPAGWLVDLSQTQFEAKAVKRLEAIHRDPTHLLCTELQAHTLARSGRLISLRAKTSRFHWSFLPASVRLCNAWSDLVTWDRPTADRIQGGSSFY